MSTKPFIWAPPVTAFREPWSFFFPFLLACLALVDPKLLNRLVKAFVEVGKAWVRWHLLSSSRIGWPLPVQAAVWPSRSTESRFPYQCCFDPSAMQRLPSCRCQRKERK